MKVVYLHILFLLLAANAFSQDVLKEAQKIRDIEQAQQFADKTPQIVFGFLHDEMNNEDYDSRKKNLNSGDTYKSGGYHVVVVAEGSKDIYRFRLLTITNQNMPNAKDQVEKLLKEINEGASYEKAFEKYAENNGPDKQVYGDVGWVDLDYFVDDFSDAVANRKKGDRFVAGDDARGWHNLVEMTHKPKKKKGHFVLLIPNSNQQSYFESIDHAKNIAKLNSREELFNYAQKYPGDVMIQLLNSKSNKQLYNSLAIHKERDFSREEVLSDGQTSYRHILDTTVELFSIQYVYLNGAEMSRETRTEAIHDIYDQFHSNVPFDSIVEQYWPDNNGLSKLQDIEGALLAPDLVEKVRSTTVGQLFVARVGQSYFLGVPLEKPKKVPAFLVISYPNLTEE
ncbi:MAG: hypothetical protein Crog4KO_13800 [Crocinitomicaceae bacterium]